MGLNQKSSYSHAPMKDLRINLSVETTMVTWGSTILAMGDLQDPIYKGGTYLPFPLKIGF